MLSAANMQTGMLLMSTLSPAATLNTGGFVGATVCWVCTFSVISVLAYRGKSIIRGMIVSSIGSPPNKTSALLCVFSVCELFPIFSNTLSTCYSRPVRPDSWRYSDLNFAEHVLTLPSCLSQLYQNHFHISEVFLTLRFKMTLYPWRRTHHIFTAKCSHCHINGYYWGQYTVGSGCSLCLFFSPSAYFLSLFTL